MTLQLLKDFVLEPAQHCITGALRHIYLFHRYPISEEMLLGLGAGVGFVYWHMQGTLPFIGGRANVGRPGEEGLEHTAGRRTGVKVAAQETTSARKAEAALVSQLQAGQPVMVYVDLGLLPYFQFPEEYHFGGHAVVVAGYEAATGRVLVADRDGVAHPVTLTTLELARGSKHKPFPPAHRWYRFDFAAAQPVSAAVIWPALREAVDHMLHPPISNLGVRGIATAAGRILDWPHSMTEPEVRAACLNTAIMIDARGGTGGGLFRYMYGRFLQAAAALTGDDRLSAAGAAFQQVGDLWQEVAALFDQAVTGDPVALLRDASVLLSSVGEVETAVWQRLHQAVTQPVAP